MGAHKVLRRCSGVEARNKPTRESVHTQLTLYGKAVVYEGGGPCPENRAATASAALSAGWSGYNGVWRCPDCRKAQERLDRQESYRQRWRDSWTEQEITGREVLRRLAMRIALLGPLPPAPPVSEPAWNPPTGRRRRRR